MIYPARDHNQVTRDFVGKATRGVCAQDSHPALTNQEQCKLCIILGVLFYTVVSVEFRVCLCSNRNLIVYFTG